MVVKEGEIMIIKEVMICGFKNIQKIKLDLSCGISALVSCNSYGKSNVLDGLKFASEFISTKPSEKEHMMDDGTFVPLNKNMDRDNFVFELLAIVCDGRYEVKYGFTFEWIKNEGGTRIIEEHLLLRTVSSKKFKKMFSRIIGNSFLKTL